jgi:CheY-like chemotaxis protein
MSGTVIYVEDEPDDVFFMQRAFHACAPEYDLKVFPNGHQAVEFLESQLSRKKEEELPRLVLLDLHLPGSSGLEILRQIRSKIPPARLPVIIYTSSNQAVDITQAYEDGCSGYLVKPASSDKLKNLVNTLVTFWIRDNQYPELKKGKSA